MNFHSEWFLARSSCQCSSAHLLNTHHFQYVFFPVRIIRRSEQNQSVCCIKTVHSVHPYAFTQQSLMTDSHRALGSRLLCCLLCCCVAQIYNAGGSVSMALHVQGSLVFPSMTDRLSEFSCEIRALFPLGDIHQWLWINSMHCKVCVCVWAREKRRQLRMPTIVILLNSQNCTTYISTNARFQPMPWTALLLPECILNKHGCPFFSLPWREFAAPIYICINLLHPLSQMAYECSGLRNGCCCQWSAIYFDAAVCRPSRVNTPSVRYHFGYLLHQCMLWMCTHTHSV